MDNHNKPKAIKRRGNFMLEAEWNDGFTAAVKCETLRDMCPCADCKHDEFEDAKPSFKGFKQFAAGRNELKNLSQIGNYAIAIAWGDGHDTGIYSYDYFRKIFDENALSQEQVIENENKKDQQLN